MPDLISGTLTGLSSGATASTISSGESKELDDLGFDTYLKLLVTQLENQDPLNPMDSTAFTEQLATFSQLEQQMASNKYLEELAQARDYSQQALAVSYIGKSALAPSGVEFEPATVPVAEGAGVGFAFELGGAASSTIIEIRNSDGAVVRTIESTGEQGIHTQTWDGTDEDGEAVPAGEYKINVSAEDNDGEKVASVMYTYSEVQAMASDGNLISLTLADGREVSLDSILQVTKLQSDS